MALSYRYNTILSGLLGSLFIGLPWIYHPAFLDAFALPKWFAIVVVTISVFLISRNRGAEMWRGPDARILLILSCLGTLLLIHAVLILSPDSVELLARWLVLTALVIVFSFFIRSVPNGKIQLFRWSGINVVLISIGILIDANLKPGTFFPDSGNGTGINFGNANFASMALVLCASLSLGLLQESSRGWRTLFWVGIFLCIPAVYLSSTNAAFAGLVTLILGFLSNRFLPLHLFKYVLLGLLLGYWIIGSMLVIQSDDPSKATQSSEAERATSWKETVAMIGEHPFLGIGSGNWKYEILNRGHVSRNQDFGSRYFVRTHNDYLQFTAELGIIGGILFTALFLVGIIGLSIDRIPDHYPFVLGLTIFAGFAFFHFPTERPYLIFILAVLFAGSYDAKGFKLQNINWILTPVLGVIALLLVLTMREDRITSMLLKARAEQNWDNVVRHASEISTTLYATDRNSHSPIAFYHGNALLMLGRAAEAKPLLEEALRISPGHPHAMSNYGNVLLATNGPGAAIRQFEKVINKYPDFVDTRVNLCRLYLYLGNLPKAMDMIRHLQHQGLSTSMSPLKELISSYQELETIDPSKQ